MTDEAGWITKGAPKKKATTTPSKGYLRTGDSANRGSPWKNTKTSPNANQNRPKKDENEFPSRNDETQYDYTTVEIIWKMPVEVFEKIWAKYPGLKELDHTDRNSRWYFMRSMEHSHWFYTDELIQEFKSTMELPAVLDSADFFAALLHHLVNNGVKPHYSPLRYTHEWRHWQKHCRVGNIALVRQNPGDNSWEVFFVKNFNAWFSELSSSWPGSKAEMQDETLWALASRELKESLNLDLAGEKSKVVAAVEGKRAVAFVLPIAYDDARLSTIQILQKDIHSFKWVPLSMDLTKVVEPARETRAAVFGITHEKSDPETLRMAWEVKDNFKKLQYLIKDRPALFETPLEDKSLLDKDPRPL